MLKYIHVPAFPLRIMNVAHTIFDALQARHMPMRLSALSPSSLRRLFPTRSIFQPNRLTLSFFPHLHHQPYPTTLLIGTGREHRKPSTLNTSVVTATNQLSSARKPTPFQQLFSFVYSLRHAIFSVATLPIGLTRHECTFKRQCLEKIRDERAATIGTLLSLRTSVARCADSHTIDSCLISLQVFANEFQTTLMPEPFAGSRASVASVDDAIEQLDAFASIVMPSQRQSHQEEVMRLGLDRPSRLTLVWPKLVFLPPLLLYGARSAYTSRTSLEQVAQDAVETLKHFWRDWLLAPLQDVVQTVRAGGNEGLIITKESVKADLDVSSLSFMKLGRATDTHPLRSH